MYLRSIAIENYRAIREARITLDRTTLLIGENDSGRTSVIEALMLVLGAPADRFETRLKPAHFHRTPGGTPGGLRVQLRFQEQSPGDWRAPEEIARVLTGGHGDRRALEFEFSASLDVATGRIAPSWRAPRATGPGGHLENSSGLLQLIRELVPVLWLRSGLLVDASDAPPAPRLKPDPLLEALELHHRNLVTGEAPDLEAELDLGARAASAVIEKHTSLFEGAAPMMGAMASDILKRRLVASTTAARHGGPAAGKIGMLLLLGAILQLTRRSVLPEGRPLLVLDNPESNLHPMTLASVWNLLERITWQKLITTNSGTLLGNAPLGSIRRLTRQEGTVREWFAPPGLLSREDLRRVAYHVRSRRASAMFARCWLLVEGETEFWMLPELARVLGYDFASEGIVPVEFAQCGLPPLIKLANCLGIAWQVLTDGDEAGDRYTATAQNAARRTHQEHAGARVAQIRERDIESCFWRHGYDDVVRRIAGATAPRTAARATIRKAIERTSKPFLALSLIEAVAERGPAGVPPIMRQVIESCVDLARTAVRARR